MSDTKNPIPASETTAVTPPTVAPGLGYPADRVVTSPEPTGWQKIAAPVTNIKPLETAVVSRETSK